VAGIFRHDRSVRLSLPGSRSPKKTRWSRGWMTPGLSGEQHGDRSSLKSRLTESRSPERVMYTGCGSGRYWPRRRASLVEKGQPM
jgi:hypothetical protein